MRRYEQDDEGPVVSKRNLPMPSNFVTPAPLARREPRTVDVPSWLVPQEPTSVVQAWEPQSGAREVTSAMDRAQALRVRLRPWLWTWGLVGAVVGGAVWLLSGAPWTAMTGALAFALLTAVTYYKLNRTDYEYSREGTERHRIDRRADLEREQMRLDHDLRKTALHGFLDFMSNEHREGR